MDEEKVYSRYSARAAQKAMDDLREQLAALAIINKAIESNFQQVKEEPDVE